MKKGKKITKLHGKEYPKGTHMCATHVEHAEWGQGKPIHSQHAAPDENGHIDWYDVMFEHGIEKNVPTANMNILAEAGHMEHAHHASDGEDLAEKMDPTDHVKKKKNGNFCVYNKDGKIVKEFDNKKEADAYAIKNHKKLMTEGVKSLFKMAGVKKPLTREQRRKIEKLLKDGDVRGAREAAKKQVPPKPISDSVENDVESLISEYFSMYFQADLTESMDSISGDDVLTAIAELNTFTVTLNEAMDRKFSSAKIGTLGYYYNQHRKRGLDPNQAYAKAKDQASRSSSDTGDRRTASVKQFRGIRAGENARRDYMDDIRKRGGSRIPGMTETYDKLTPSQARDAARRLKPTRATVANVKLPSTDAERERYAKKAMTSRTGRNPSSTKQRRLNDLQLRSHVEHDGPVLDEGSLGVKRMARKLQGERKAATRAGTIAQAAGIKLNNNPLHTAATRTERIGGVVHGGNSALRTQRNRKLTPIESRHPNVRRASPDQVKDRATDAVVAGARGKTPVADAIRRAKSIINSKKPFAG